MKSTTQRSLGQWLFNPFRYIAGFPALCVGLVIILLSAFIASLSDMHFDGVLDVHGGKSGPLWIFLAEGLIDWLCMAVMLVICGLLFSRSSFRPIDVFGTQALARWPCLLTSLVVLPQGFRRYGAYLTWKYSQIGSAVTVEKMDILFFGLGSMIILLMIIWMVALMYRAYVVSCNVKGGRAIGSFIGSLIIAEILSKLAIWHLLPYM